MSTSELDGAALRGALGCFATGVCVVTARTADGRDLGMTCNSFSAVSLDPPLVLWSIQRRLDHHRDYCEAPGFAVSVLSVGQSDLAMRFASGDPAGRFAKLALERSPAGLALVPGALAWFDCRHHQRVEAGDHDILIGRVEAFEQREGEALIFARSRFGRVLEHAA